MNWLRILKLGAAAAALFIAYLAGVNQGRDSEELKNARVEISNLNATVAQFKTRQNNDATALAELRRVESTSRNELERMRSQLAIIERRAQNDSDRQRNRCLGLAVRYKEVVERADRAIKFCAENHK